MVDTLIQKKRYSLEEYFAMEEKAAEKHEYHNGKIIPMAGGSIPHNKIAVNLTRTLDNWIEENKLPFVVLNSDTKIRIEKYNRSVYPDALVVCEKVEYWGGRTDIILNPTLIFEVLSDSTEEHDRGSKFSLYRLLPSFKEYVLIDQYKPWVDSYFKRSEEEGLWKISSAMEMDTSIRLHTVGFDLPLSKIYWQVPELQGEAWEG
ncbi:MAG: Uma2 family endonuclease [Saprospiraceae bacterium]|nr:MAG: Uma2 family endonuclease [Saprospiraceae bacterium]